MYPAGIGIKISKFASDYMDKHDTRSVTAGDHTYKLYTYEGKLSDIENAKVRCLRKTDSMQAKAYFVFCAPIVAWMSLLSCATMLCIGIPGNSGYFIYSVDPI